MGWEKGRLRSIHLKLDSENNVAPELFEPFERNVPMMQEGTE